MAPVHDVFSDALMIIRGSGNGRVVASAEMEIDVDYENLSSMLTDAQMINHRGYTTKLNRQMYSMTVSV